MTFIGHLDIMRYFQKAIRRGEIDIAYSGGFSPHQIMSFAAPLGVGYYSNGEYLDIEVNSHQGRQDMLDRLNRVMVEGIRVLNVAALPDDAGNAMASVAATCIIPLQDYLGLDNSARTNKPSTVGQNWRWRVDAKALTP